MNIASTPKRRGRQTERLTRKSAISTRDSASLLTGRNPGFPPPDSNAGRAAGECTLFEKPDWRDYGTIEGLCRKAGTDREGLAAVVVKELVDNSLDASEDCDLSLSGGKLIVQDRGAGIGGDDDRIARLFSISRDKMSSKHIRLPTRGALGNGLRVVVGAVLATSDFGGKLTVATRGRVLRIVPDPVSGESKAVPVGPYDGPGTRIELELGGALALKPDDLLMSEVAIVVARARKQKYTGKTSPHWYDAESFHDLLLSITSDDLTVRDFIAGHFDGCYDHAGEIADGLAGRPARSLTREEAGRLLGRAKATAREVNPSRLKAIGKDAFSGAYSKFEGYIDMPGGVDDATIDLPIIVEAWADPSPANSSAVFMVNGTPCIADADAWFRKKEMMTTVYGPGLRLNVKTGKAGILLHVNITTPFMPMTSDGKEPSLGWFRSVLEEVIEKAARRAKKLRPRDALRPNIKSVVFAHLAEQVAIVSDNRRYRFNWRQVFYRLRPIVKAQLGEDLNWDYFSQTLVLDYEEAHGKERLAYRDPRGTFYEPHGGREFPLGTLAVEEYRREPWRYNKVLFIEKEGFAEALKADGWPERHDCAMMSSKGQPTGAARDLIDLIGETDEPVQVFCAHDSDCSGTIILQSLQEETRVRARRNIEIIDLGLNPWEAVELAARGIVAVEDVSYATVQAVADYIDERWRLWLQKHRVELNAFTTAHFIEWLDGKMATYLGKVIPPPEVLSRTLDEEIRGRLRDAITREVLAAARVEERVRDAYDRMHDQVERLGAKLVGRVSEDLRDDPSRHWGVVVSELARTIATDGEDRP
jgi:hypothetical protein